MHGFGYLTRAFLSRAEAGEIPAEICRLLQLEKLALNENKLTGECQRAGCGTKSEHHVPTMGHDTVSPRRLTTSSGRKGIAGKMELCDAEAVSGARVMFCDPEYLPRPLLSWLRRRDPGPYRSSNTAEGTLPPSERAHR